jgi:hypothetical protein
MQERKASFFDEDTTGIREFQTQSPIASEQVKSMLFFEVRNLSAERRLADVQFIRGPREVQFLGQDDDGMQLMHFKVGEHCSKSFRQTAKISQRPICVKERPGGKNHQKMFVKLDSPFYLGTP